MAEPKRKSDPRGTPAKRAELRTVAGKGLGAAQALDRLIHERVRLGIVSALAVHPRLGFTELRDLLDVTDGNLSVHARKLEVAGYIRCDKSFSDRVPRTEYTLTAKGRTTLEQYLDHMQSLIAAARGGDGKGREGR